jgi:lipopolysaccharide biosynthesis protein
MLKPKFISFYLPQYHPIPENDEWWGKGFTEWVSVAKSKPRFRNHHQPQIPSDLGFYDLRLEESRIAQAALAEQNGIHGFCYYHYWFNGKLLLERPFNEVLNSGKPDFPFCLCWANENWTRRWDGLEKEILIKQNYPEYDPRLHISWLEKAFSDKRYIRINGKPLFLIYNLQGIHNFNKIIAEWREIAIEKGFPGLFICSVKSIHNKLDDQLTINSGVDALVDFMPDFKDLPKPAYKTLPGIYVKRTINKILKIFTGGKERNNLEVTYRHNYKKMVERVLSRSRYKYKTFPCAAPSWDNSARRKFATVIQNDDSMLFKKWLEHNIDLVKENHEEEQIIFINAWNEWAEGCHLEPDLRNGKRFLEAVREVISYYK